MAYSLTKNQRDMMLIVQELHEPGYPVTYRALAHEMDVGVNIAHWIIQALVERGWLRIQRTGAHPSIEIVSRIPMPQECRIAPMITIPAWLLDPATSPQAGEAA